MDFVQWRRERRCMSRHEIEDFYENPLREITVFRFETAGLEVPEHHGAFSLKSVQFGREDYFFHGRSVALGPQQILLVNADERYGSEVSRHTRSLAVFFRASDLGTALEALTVPAELLLESHGPASEPEVAQVALAHDRAVLHQLAALHHALDLNDDERATETAMCLLLAALAQNRRLAPPTALANVRKRSTRDELITRVLQARDLIIDTQGQERSLDDLAHAACLSRYHFLRVFTELTGMTPVAFARRSRLQAAHASLRRGEKLEDVAVAAGYLSPKAFIRAYRRQFGAFPPALKN